MNNAAFTRVEDLPLILKARFDAHPHRHPNTKWAHVAARLKARPATLRGLLAMEESGGEPDVVGLDERTGEVIFFDCSAETPHGRRSLCYDSDARLARKENRPAGSAMEAAAAMGAELLSEDQYRLLQQLGEFDLKTSSWLKTPADVRQRGGALFGDRRYGRVFTYHNGVQSYYAGRGFRVVLHV